MEELTPLGESLNTIFNPTVEFVEFLKESFPEIDAIAIKLRVEALSCSDRHWNTEEQLLANMRLLAEMVEDTDTENEVNALAKTFEKIQELLNINNISMVEEFINEGDKPDAEIFDERIDCESLDWNDQDFHIVTTTMDPEYMFGRDRSCHKISDDTWVVSKAGSGKWY